MIQTAQGIENMTLDIKKEMHVQAPLAVTFEALLEQIGPYNERPADLKQCGPLFASYPFLSNVQYRLTEKDGGTLISFRHSAIGLIEDQHREGVSKGWTSILDRIRKRAEAK
jgi:uncharacterized protein YndB with AHSA1/START domain